MQWWSMENKKIQQTQARYITANYFEMVEKWLQNMSLPLNEKAMITNRYIITALNTH